MLRHFLEITIRVVAVYKEFSQHT